VSADVEVVFVPWPYDAVARGVALLDEKVPGWRKNEDVPFTLIGLQEFADCRDPRHYGLSVPFGMPPWSFERLDDAWREAIAGGES
jgi:hypothetical protein